MNQVEWLRQDASGDVTLTLHVQPGARRTEAAGLHGDALKIRLAAPPVDGKANAALIAFIADVAGLPRNRVELVGGAASRRKLLRVDAPAPEMVRRLRALAG